MSRPLGPGRHAAMTFDAISVRTGVSRTTVYRDYRSALGKLGLALDAVPRRAPRSTAANKLALT